MTLYDICCDARWKYKNLLPKSVLESIDAQGSMLYLDYMMGNSLYYGAYVHVDSIRAVEQYLTQFIESHHAKVYRDRCYAHRYITSRYNEDSCDVKRYDDADADVYGFRRYVVYYRFIIDDKSYIFGFATESRCIADRIAHIDVGAMRENLISKFIEECRAAVEERRG